MAVQGIQSFRIGQYSVDPDTCTISCSAGTSEVSRDEMQLLITLACAPHQFVGSQKLLAAVDENATVGSPELLQMISRLTEELGDRGSPSNLIVGSIDKGYMLCADVVWEDIDESPVLIEAENRQNSDFENFVRQLSDDTSHEASGQSVSHRLTPPISEAGWFEALKQRRIFRAAGAYAVASWLIMQITAHMVGAFPAIPPSATGTITIVLAIGFPVALLLAWLLQVTPAGIVIDMEPDGRRGSVKDRLVHLIDVFVIGILVVIVAILGFDRYTSNKVDGVSVAVLAFANSNEMGDNQYLGVGIADNIRTRLTNVDKLLVAAPPSRELQPNQDMTVKSIGERLDVENVLYGSVKRADDRVRLDVHLVDVATGFSKWGKSYEVSLEDMLKVNSDISLYVASELEVILTKELRASLEGNPTDVPEAYEAYLEGRNYLELPRNNHNLAKAILYFKEAVDKDPGFALAFAGQCEAFTAVYLDSADTQAVDLAEVSCKKALELDNGMSAIHVALGNLFVVAGRIDAAEQSFVKALELDESSLGAITGIGRVYEARGEYLSAERQFRLAIDKLPNDWNGYYRLAGFLLGRGRYEEAAQNYRHVLAFMPDNVDAYNNLGAAYFFMGNFAKAAEHYRRSLQLEPILATYSNIGSSHYYDGNFSDAIAMYKRAVELSSKDYRVWGNLADAQRFDSNTLEESKTSYAKAIELARSQLEINSDDVEIQSNLAYYFSNVGETDKARALLNKIGLTPNINPEYQYTTALSFRLIGEIKRSDQMLNEAKIQGFPEVILKATPELTQPELINSYRESIYPKGAKRD